MSVEPPRELPKAIASGDQHCAACGYDLRGLTIARCPECGVPFEQDGHVLAAIPWLQRRAIGRWSAFWATVRLVLTRPALLVEQVRADVELGDDDAGRFRCVSTFIAALSIASAVTLAAATESQPIPLKSLPILFGACTLSALLFFYFAGFPLDQSGFEKPNDARRFRRLHEFTSAPLAMMPIVPLLGAIVLIKTKHFRWEVLYLASGAVIIAWLVFMLRFQIHAARRKVLWVFGNILATLFFWSLAGVAAYVMCASTYDVLDGWIRNMMTNAP